MFKFRTLAAMTALALGLATSAQATLLSFTGGIAIHNDGSTGVTNNSINFDDVAAYEEAGYRFQFVGTDSAFSSNVGDFYELGNDVLQGHWATGNYGYLTQIRLTRIDGSAFSLSSLDIVSNSDTGGGPASGNEQVFIHGSVDGSSDDFSVLLPSDDHGFPATGFSLGSPFENVKAIWFDVVGASDSFGVDNFQLGDGRSVPEPASLALFGMALSAMLVLRRRRAS